MFSGKTSETRTTMMGLVLALGLALAAAAHAGTPVSDGDELASGTSVDFEITGHDMLIPNLNSIRHDSQGNPYYTVQWGQTYRGYENPFDGPSRLEASCTVFLRPDAEHIRSTDGARPVGGKISLRSTGWQRDGYLHLIAQNDRTFSEIACTGFRIGIGPGNAGVIRAIFNGTGFLGDARKSGIVIATPTVVAANGENGPTLNDGRDAKAIAPAAIATTEPAKGASQQRAI